MSTKVSLDEVKDWTDGRKLTFRQFKVRFIWGFRSWAGHALGLKSMIESEWRTWDKFTPPEYLAKLYKNNQRPDTWEDYPDELCCVRS